MDTKNAGLAVVTAHTSIPLQIKELPVLIVRTDGVVDVTAQARFNAKECLFTQRIWEGRVRNALLP